MDSGKQDSISIHPLVHSWAHERLDDAARKRKTAETAVLLGCIYKEKNGKSVNDWIFERRIYAHINSCHGNIKCYIPQDDGDIFDERFLEAAGCLGRLQVSHGHSKDGISLHKLVYVKLQQSCQEGESLMMLNTARSIGAAFYVLAEYDDALQWYRQKLAGFEKEFGSEHRSTLGTVHNMAVVFDNQGKYDEAIEWFKRALDGKERALGKEHPSTFDTVHNMAAVFCGQKKYDDAIEWCGRALHIFSHMCIELLGSQKLLQNSELLSHCYTINRPPES